MIEVGVPFSDPMADGQSFSRVVPVHYEMA